MWDRDGKNTSASLQPQKCSLQCTTVKGLRQANATEYSESARYGRLSASSYRGTSAILSFMSANIV